MRINRPAGYGGRRAASLLFDKRFGFKKGAEIVFVFAGNARFHRFNALISRRRIKITAIAAGVQVIPAVFAAVNYLNLTCYLYFSRAVVAPRYQVKFCFHPAAYLEFALFGTGSRFIIPL
ncbi:MAG: hypothetical protein LBJ21_10140 [Acidobacteriota bacterium]|jgi:hypothetical protein|nr:hypothetical protein [Acidobacteriota bacterium]